MFKWIALTTSALCSLAFAGLIQPPRVHGVEPSPLQKKKHEPGKKGEPGPPGGPGGDLRRTYDMLRRLRADSPVKGPEGEKSHDWTERATGFYRKAVRAVEAGDHRLSHAYGAAAHDLARAAEHTRNAARSEKLDRPDPELPPPPSAEGADDESEHVRHDLRRAHERLVETERDAKEAPDGRFYFDAARDLYNNARRDAEGHRWERAGELARASEAMTHVPEHLARAAVDGREDGPPPKKEARRGRPEGPPHPGDGPPPKKEARRGRPGDGPPPPRGEEALPPPF